MANLVLQRVLTGLLFAWLPLAFFVRAADGFTLTKEIVGLGVAAFVGGLILTDGRWVFRSNLSKALFAFALWMMADSLFVGLVKVEALKGAVHVLLMVGTFYSVLYACGRGISYEKLIYFSLIAALLMSLHGLAQTFGAEGINWNNRFESRAFATLGNPDYLGGELAALLPLAFILTLQAERRQGWLLFRGISLAFLACLWATRVRGAYLAAAGGMTIILAMFFLPWGMELFRRNARYVMAVFVGLAIAGGVYLERHGGLALFNASQVSVQQRLETYKVAWEMVKEHPWAGIGMGQLGIQYPRYQSKPFTPAEYAQHPYTYSEHVHNEFLQFWAEGGLPGLLLFLAVLGAFAMALGRFWRDPGTKSGDKELLIGVAGGVVALLIQSFSNFPLQVAPTAVLFGLFLAAPLALASSPRPLGERERGEVRLSWVLIGLVFLVGIRAMASSIAYRDTVGETSLNQFQNAIYYGKRLTDLSLWNYKAWYAYGKALEGAGKAPEAIAAYTKAFEIDPNYVEGLTTLGNLQLQVGQLEEGVNSLAKAEALAPNYAGPVWYRATGLFRMHRFDEAAQEFKKVTALSPNNALAYSNLGVCYIKLGHKAEAVAAWQKAHALDPNDGQVVQYLKAQGAL